MEWGPIFEILRESLALILLFFVLLAYTMIRGIHALVSIVLGLYIALLISLKFPYYDALYSLTEGDGSNTLLSILLFFVFTFIGTAIFRRLLPGGYDDSTFDQFGKKLLFAFLAAALIMTYSYHVLPITTYVEPGTSVSLLFAPEENFFWWLIIPLIALFLL